MLATYMVGGLVVYFLIGTVTSGLLLRWDAADEEAAPFCIIAWPLIWFITLLALVWEGLKSTFKFPWRGLIKLQNKIAGRK